MDHMTAYMRGRASRDAPLRVFDWEKAARLIVQHKPRIVSAGLSGDWGCTGDAIYDADKGGPLADAGTYLSSTWAIPEIQLSCCCEDEDDGDCWRYQEDLAAEGKDWGPATVWPQEALVILAEAGLYRAPLSDDTRNDDSVRPVARETKSLFVNRVPVDAESQEDMTYGGSSAAAWPAMPVIGYSRFDSPYGATTLRTHDGVRYVIDSHVGTPCPEVILRRMATERGFTIMDYPDEWRTEVRTPAVHVTTGGQVTINGYDITAALHPDDGVRVVWNGPTSPPSVFLTLTNADVTVSGIVDAQPIE